MQGHSNAGPEGPGGERDGRTDSGGSDDRDDDGAAGDVGGRDGVTGESAARDRDARGTDGEGDELRSRRGLLRAAAGTGLTAGAAATTGCLGAITGGGGDGGGGDGGGRETLAPGEFVVRVDEPTPCDPGAVETTRFDADGTPFVAAFDVPAVLERLGRREPDDPFDLYRTVKAPNGRLRFGVGQGTVPRSEPTVPPADRESRRAPRTVGEVEYDGATRRVFTTTPLDPTVAARHVYLPFDGPDGRLFVLFTVRVETSLDDCESLAGPLATATLRSLSPASADRLCELIVCEPV